jgi:putative membrane protein (TIGR04086 family)
MQPTSIFTGLRIRPIVTGVIVDYVATYVAMFAYIALVVSRKLLEEGELSEEVLRRYAASPEGLLSGFAIGTLCIVLGGFIAGRLAKALEVKHGAAVGVGSMIVSTLEQAMAENSVPLPEWFVLISYLAAIPAGAVGGYLAERLREFGAGGG